MGERDMVTALPDAPGRDLTLAMIADEAGFAALQPEWDALATQMRARGCLRHAWALAGWMHSMKPRGGRLCIITARDSGALVGLWPLARFQHRFHRELRPLGWDAWDVVDLLVAPGPAQAIIVDALWTAACRQGQVLYVPYVQTGSLLADCIDARAVWTARDPFRTYVADFQGHADFASYGRSITRSGSKDGPRRRRLGKLGALQFRHETDPARRLAVLRWALAQKLAWAQRRGVRSEAITDQRFTAFLESLAAGSPEQSPLRVFSLCLDDQVIAADIATLGGSVLDSHIIAFDHDWARHSPGSLLQGDVLRWAQERGLAFDFGVTEDAYKAEWCNSRVVMTRHVAALTPGGLAAVAWHWRLLCYRRLRSRYRRALGWVVSRLIKPRAVSLVKRLRVRAGVTYQQ